MDFKETIKKKLQDYHRAKIRYPNNNKSNEFNYNSIKNTALLFFIKGKSDLDVVRSVIRKARNDDNKINTVIYSDVNHNVDVITDRDFHIFNSDDFDYRWRPKQQLQQWLDNHNFDLVINFCFDGRPEMINIYSLLNSKFRIANQNTDNFIHSDLTINIKENQVDFNSFYNLAIQNLKMLNIKRS
mgnify:CR=1 FL=1